jgi:hypothetical protein
MQKNREVKLPVDQQAAKHVARVKYAPLTFISIEARAVQLKLKDPLLFNAFQLLEKGEDSAAFLQLYQYAKDGKLKGYDTFTEICEVLTDRIRRQTSDNDNLKYGVRYPANYLNFMILLRSYGSNSARQYGILTSQLGGPSSRHLRFVYLSCSSHCNLLILYGHVEHWSRSQKTAFTNHNFISKTWLGSRDL